MNIPLELERLLEKEERANEIVVENGNETPPSKESSTGQARLARELKEHFAALVRRKISTVLQMMYFILTNLLTFQAGRNIFAVCATWSTSDAR